MDDPFAMTTDINGKPIPHWQARLEAMYTDYVPFGEILSYVRYLLEERGGSAILNMSDDHYCLSCSGKGGAIERQDPVGDGVGFEEFLILCDDCLGAGKCPWCGGAVDKEYNCANETCLWTPDQIDAPGSFDDDDGT